MNRDNDAFEAIQAILLGQPPLFAVVLKGLQPPDLPAAGGLFPRAWIKPAGWTEDDKWDPESKLRTVRYRLEITAVYNDGEDSIEELDRLAAVVQDALEGQDYGFCLPALSVCHGGDYPTAAASSCAEQTLTLKGEFAYLLDGYAGRNTAPSTPLAPPFRWIPY